MISQLWNITAIAPSHINMKYSGDLPADSGVNDPLLKQREERREGEPVVNPDWIIIWLEHSTTINTVLQKVQFKSHFILLLP